MDSRRLFTDQEKRSVMIGSPLRTSLKVVSLHGHFEPAHESDKSQRQREIVTIFSLSAEAINVHVVAMTM